MWYDKKKCAFTMDLGEMIDIARVNTYSWHGGDRGPQKFNLRGSVDGNEWTQIAKVDSFKLGHGGKHGSSILRDKGTLGSYRYLRWMMLYEDIFPPPSTRSLKVASSSGCAYKVWMLPNCVRKLSEQRTSLLTH